MMTPMRGVLIAFWLFCVGSCVVFLYNDYVSESTESDTSKAVKSSDAKQGETCPLGFTGTNPHGGEAPINPPIPEPTKRDPKAEVEHRARCDALVDTNNH